MEIEIGLKIKVSIKDGESNVNEIDRAVKGRMKEVASGILREVLKTYQSKVVLLVFKEGSVMDVNTIKEKFFANEISLREALREIIDNNPVGAEVVIEQFMMEIVERVVNSVVEDKKEYIPISKRIKTFKANYKEER